MGTVYLLHFDPPLRHASHYIGIAEDGDVQRRLGEHLRGLGSPLVAAAVSAGSTVRVVRTWEGDRGTERRKKNSHGPDVCPECRPLRRIQPRLPLFRRRIV